MPNDSDSTALPPPAIPPQQMEQLWRDAMDALHTPGIKRADVDDYLRKHSNGVIPSFDHLVQLRGATTPEQPGLLPSILTSFGAGASLDAAPAADPALADYLAQAERAHPLATRLSHAAGTLPTTALLTEAAAPLAALARFIPGFSKLPALLRLGAQGATAAGLGAGAATAVEQGAHGEFDPHEFAKQMGLAAALGGPLGMIGAWRGLKLDPSEHLLGRGVQESAPGIRPGFKAGLQAIQEGTTTPDIPITPGAASVPPLSDADVARLPEVLRPLNVERSPALRALGGKVVPLSAQGAAEAKLAITQRMTDLEKAADAITEHPTTGYDAVLKPHQVNPVEDPQAFAVLKERQSLLPRPMRGQTDARTAFDLFKRLRKMAATATDDNVRVSAAHDADALRGYLGQIPEFENLQARVAPYLQRRAQLKTLMRQIVGRAIKPLGKAAPIPTGGTEEGLKESFGFDPTQIGETAARKLVSPIFRSTESDALREFVTDPRSLPALLSRHVPAVGAGLLRAGERAVNSKTKPQKDRLGLLTP